MILPPLGIHSSERSTDLCGCLMTRWYAKFFLDDGERTVVLHRVQRKMISVDNFFVFSRLLFFALLLLSVT